jgi:actin-like ATPase involved in cell morphogenesis
MSFQLGVDVGTTFTAAAVAREGQVEVASLGWRSAAIPSVVWVGGDGTVLTGDVALRRGLSEPSRMAREFKRRVGDPAPLLLGGAPFSADALTAKLLGAVTEEVIAQQGDDPEAVTVCHPANWGPFKKDLLRQAIRQVGLEDAALLTEPEAAAIYYASTERLADGDVLAVYDLGGGTFDAAVLRKTTDGFELLGQPEGIERLGGIDFDEAVLGFVNEATEGALDELDPSDPDAVEAIVQVREECVIAKEVLSGDTEASIQVWLPQKRTRVRLTRAEFEALVRPTLVDTVTALRRALQSADLEPSDVTKVLLVGGSSRIPLVGQLIGAELGRPVAVDAHPKHAIALGAALHAASTVGRRAAMSAEHPDEPSAVKLAEPPTDEQIAHVPPTSIISPSAAEAAHPDPAVSGPTILVGTPPGQTDTEAEMVPGIYCANGHFNDPRAPYCAVCSTALSQDGHDVVEGPRPPLGVLVLDDGETFVVDGDYIVGRLPDTDEAVQSGDARPLTLLDPARSISRVHARVEVDEWDVRIADCISANGTFVATEGSGWTRVLPGHPVTIHPGTHVLLGQRVMLFDAYRRA